MIGWMRSATKAALERKGVEFGSGVMMVTSLLSSALGLLFWMVVSRYYSIEDVGISAALFSGIGLVMLFSTLGFDIALIRFLPTHPDQPRLINNCISVVSVVSGLFSFAVMLMLVDVVLRSTSGSSILPLMILFLMISVLGAVSSLQNTALIAARDYTSYLVVVVLYMIVRVPLAATFARMGLTGLLVGMLIATALALALVTRAFLPRQIPNYRMTPVVDTELTKHIFPFSLSNYVSRISYAIPALLLPILVVVVGGPEVGAYFYIAWTASALLLVIPTSVSTSLLVEISHRGCEVAPSFRKALVVMISLFTPLFLLLFFWGEFFLSFFGNDFSEHGFNLLRLLTLSSVFSLPISLFVAKARYEKNSLKIVYPYAMTALISVLGGVILSDSMGSEGFALAWMIGNIVVAISIVNEVFSSLR